MIKRDSVDYFKLNGVQKFFVSLLHLLINIPVYIWNILKSIGLGIWSAIKYVGLGIAEIVKIFFKGDFLTKMSFLIMGFGQLFRRQVMRGLLFMLLEVVFIVYMVVFGWGFLSDLGSLGDVAQVTTLNEFGLEIVEYKDNSLQILLYSTLTIFFCIGVLYTWVLNVKQNYLAQTLIAEGIRPKAFKDDLRSLADEQYYKTLLALPLMGIIIFTVIPIFFMILVAFTNYDYSHLPPNKLFDWVGLQNFQDVLGLSAGTGKFAYTFGEILIWTLIWAVLATFTNYFLGIFVALMINKKGIKFKKGFRTILVMTIAVPQFVSLLLVSKMFGDYGIINSLLMSWGWIDNYIPFLTDPTLARVMVIAINLWVGIPYLMLVATGILMNIPADLYESAKIDGASGFKQFTKITMPYMLFVTGPYLLTSFTSNINNFNVIYLLTGGAPKTLAFDGGAGYTDLLITWLYKLTLTDNNYKMAAVIGIMTFVVVAGISLIVYNVSPAVKNEESFQ